MPRSKIRLGTDQTIWFFSAVSPRQVYQLLQLCRRLASLVVLDVPCTFDDLQFETLALADQTFAADQAEPLEAAGECTVK